MADVPNRNLGLMIALSNEEASEIGLLDFLSSFFTGGGGGIPLPTTIEKLGGNKTVFRVLENVLHHTMLNFEAIQSVFQYWRSIITGFPFKERIEIDVNDVSPETLQNMHQPIPAERAADVNYLTFMAFIRLRHKLAIFLSNFYALVDSFGAPNTVESLLHDTHLLFHDLIASLRLIDTFSTITIPFEELPVRQWGDMNSYDIRDSNSIKTNMNYLDEFLYTVVKTYRKPSKTIPWMPYAFGAIGISLISVCLLHHSSFNPKETIAMLFRFLIQEPIEVITDAVHSKSGKESTESQQVELTSTSVTRMLSDYLDQVEDLEVPANASDEELFTRRFEIEIKNPLWNIVRGNVVQGALTWGQMFKLAVDKLLLVESECRGVFKLVWALLRLSAAVGFPVKVAGGLFPEKDAKGTLNLTRILTGELDKMVRQITKHLRIRLRTLGESTLGDDGKFFHGLLLLVAGNVFKLVEPAAKEYDEWNWARLNLAELGKPDIQIKRRSEILADLRRLRCFGCLNGY